MEGAYGRLSPRSGNSGEKGVYVGGLVIADESLLCPPKRSWLFLGSG